MHIIINAVGSSGDINPMLVLGMLLMQQGHRVDFMCSPVFEEKVARCGLNLLPLGTKEQYYDTLKNPEVWQFNTAFACVWDLVMQATGEAYRLIEKHHETGNTLLIGTSLATGARLAQEKLNLPMVSVHLSPAVILSAYNTPQSATSPMPSFAPRILKSLWINGFDNLVLDKICCPPLNKLRQQIGLAPVRQIITKWLHSPQLVLCAFPDWFASVQVDWPPNCVTTNFPLYKSTFDEPLSNELEDFLDSGTPPVVLTAGTAMAFAGKFIETGLRAAQEAGLRALVICTFEKEVPKLPANSMHVKYANFDLLFKRCAMVVHHGGIGTSATALASGCPQLISPFAHDQFDNALRLEKLGVGRMLRNAANVTEWGQSMRRMQTPEVLEECRLYSDRINSAPTGEQLMIDAIKSAGLLHA